MTSFVVTRVLKVVLAGFCLCAAVMNDECQTAVYAQKKSSGKGKKPSFKGSTKKKSSSKKKSTRKKQIPPPPRIPAMKSHKDKMRYIGLIKNQFTPSKRITTAIHYSPDDLDDALIFRIGLPRYKFSSQIDDEQFIRRVSLDLMGRVPAAEVVKKFVASQDEDKRSHVIDELLATEAYARKWAQFWVNVIFYNSTVKRQKVDRKVMEDWLFNEFRKGTGWDVIVANMVAAVPVRDKRKDVKNKVQYWGQDFGPNNYALVMNRDAEVMASETARIFMGIQIQCAQCHDHPFDNWRREQFHEMAAFFKPGKYYMTDAKNSEKKIEMEPRFLLGEKPDPRLKPDQRRVAMAAYLVYNPDNYWFARAYVNRVWSELMGDGFYAVDSLGPDGEVIHKEIINRMAAVFRYRVFDPKWAFRLIMNSRAYQRDIRSIEDEADLFTAVRPTRMRPREIAASVIKLTGANPGLRRMVQSTFDVDPSIPHADLEGSIQQALLVMNNGTLNGRLANSNLKKSLIKINSDRRMIDELYLGILARKATTKEMSRVQTYLKKVKNRTEAIDDLMWVLVNSMEFITKR